MKKVNEILKTLLCLPLAAVFCLSISCEREARMVPFQPRFNILDYPKVPAIVVGQALEKCHPAAPPVTAV